jgi:hypothetical protein
MNEIKKQVKDIKLFWELFKNSGCLFQATYILTSFAAVIIYIVSPDLIPGPVDDLLIAPWFVPFVLSKVWAAFLPDWFILEQKHKLEKKLSTKPMPKPTKNKPIKEEPKNRVKKGPEPEKKQKLAILTHNEDWSSFHLNSTLSEYVKTQPKIRRGLKKFCEIKQNGENLLILQSTREKESSTISELSKIEGLTLKIK